MKVLLIDYPNFRTTRHWMKWLQRNHELVTDMYADPEKMAQADVIWLEWCEYAAILASQGRYDDSNFHLWNDKENRFGPGGSADWSHAKLFIRPIDIDIHYGHFRGVKWENVTGMAYIAPHFGRILQDGMQYPPALKIEETRLSVDLEEWAYRVRAPGPNIAWINEGWSAKNLPGAIYALHALVQITGWEDSVLHVVENKRSGEQWLHRHVQHLIRVLGLEKNVKFLGEVASIDVFLEDMNFLWQTSMKEGFSLIMAEALAKGIKALTLNWESSTDIWPRDLVADTPGELAMKTILHDYDSPLYRSFAAEYSHVKEIQQLRNLTGL